jgi:hypothetical protein
MGTLIVRIQSPSGVKSIFEGEKVCPFVLVGDLWTLPPIQTPEKFGHYHVKFVPTEAGAWLAWTIFNEAMLHQVPATIRIKKK